MFSRVFFPGVFLCLAVGCSSGWGGIMALRQYSAGQSEIARYIKNGESHFNMLIADIEKRNIKIGAKYNDILRRYGEPVLIWNTEAPSLISKTTSQR